MRIGRDLLSRLNLKLSLRLRVNCMSRLLLSWLSKGLNMIRKEMDPEKMLILWEENCLEWLLGNSLLGDREFNDFYFFIYLY